MSESPAELADFFTIGEVDADVFDRYADSVFASARTRERFGELVAEFRDKASSSEADKLKLAVGLLLLGKYGDALDAFGRAGSSRFRYYFAAQAAEAMGRLDDAVESYKGAAKAGWDAFECDMRIAAVQLRDGNDSAARKLVEKHESAGVDRAEWHYVRGLLAEYADNRDAAIEAYDKALTLNPNHIQCMFRAAWVYDIRGEDERSIDLYCRLAEMPRAYVNALINLAVIHEDRGEYDDALVCLQRVLAAYPNHARARLFYKDVQSSRQMIIDDSIEVHDESRHRLLETSISEFELSVRARNCLKKMQIRTLGDLLKLSETELLAYKNFGETSLNEIKALLSKKGLRLGQSPDEIDAALALPPAAAPAPRVSVPPGSEGILHKPVSELELSVRARRCLQRLNISTIGDLIQHSENDLLSTRNFGVTSLNEIKGRLGDMGLSLAPKQ